MAADGLICEGDHLVLDVNGEKLSFVQKLKATGTIRVGKHHVSAAPLIGAPYGSLFEVTTDGKALQRVLLPPADEITRITETERDNSKLFDRNTENQKLTHEEIEELKKSGKAGTEIIEALCSNSATFQNKTEFSQDKYKRRKAKKYLTFLTVRKPTARIVCEAFTDKSAERVWHLRHDSLAVMMSLANVAAGAKVLVVENCMGVITAAAVERLGGMGAICAAQLDERPAPLDAVRQMNLSVEQRSALFTAHASVLLRDKEAAGKNQSASGSRLSPWKQAAPQQLPSQPPATSQPALPSQEPLKDTAPTAEAAPAADAMDTTCDTTGAAAAAAPAASSGQQQEPAGGAEAGAKSEAGATEAPAEGSSGAEAGTSSAGVEAMQVDVNEAGAAGAAASSETAGAETGAAEAGPSGVAGKEEDVEAEAEGAATRKDAPASGDVAEGSNRRARQQQHRAAAAAAGGGGGGGYGSFLPRPEVVRSVLATGFDSCLLAVPKVHPTALLDTLWPLLAPSATFAVYSPWAQPLAEALNHLQASRNAVMLQVQESWLRPYQVLPSRTHPHMSCSGTGGYILSGIKIVPPDATSLMQQLQQSLGAAVSYQPPQWGNEGATRGSDRPASPGAAAKEGEPRDVGAEADPEAGPAAEGSKAEGEEGAKVEADGRRQTQSPNGRGGWGGGRGWGRRGGRDDNGGGGWRGRGGGRDYGGRGGGGRWGRGRDGGDRGDGGGRWGKRKAEGGTDRPGGGKKQAQ